MEGATRSSVRNSATMSSLICEIPAWQMIEARMPNDQRMRKQRRDSLRLTPLFRAFRIRTSFDDSTCRSVRHLFALSLSLQPAARSPRSATSPRRICSISSGFRVPQVSPDGSRVAFVRVTVNEKKEGYNTSIWTVPLEGGEEPHQLTKGDHDSGPRWSPDGKFLLFLRTTEKNSKPEPPQLAILPMAGGDSFVFTDLPKGAASPSWAPDGKTIAFTSETNAEDLANRKRKNQRKKNQKKLAGMLLQTQMSTRAMFA